MLFSILSGRKFLNNNLEIVISNESSKSNK